MRRTKRRVGPGETHSRSVALWVCGIIVVATLVGYARTFSFPFIFDDLPAIVENPSIRSLADLGEVLSPPAVRGNTVGGRPLLNLSFAMNFGAGGTRVTGYHVVNVAIHVLAGLMLFGLVWRTLQRPELRGRFGPTAWSLALAVAGLWVLHPLQTESVTYVAQRAESMMGLFFLTTLYGFARGVESPRANTWFGLAVVACACGMATKEVMVTAPVMVWLYDRTFVSGSFREAWRRHRGVHAALAATWLLLIFLVVRTGDRGGTIGPATGLAWWQYALCQARAVPHYLQLALWPQPLIFDYGHDFVGFADVAGHLVMVIALVAATAVAVGRKTAIGFLGAWYFVILAPSSSVVGGSRQMIAEHRIYLSLAAVVVVLVVGLHRLLGRRAPLVCAGLAAVALLQTVARNEDYRTDVSIWRDTVAKRPENEMARNNLGFALARAGRMAEAAEQFAAALRLDPLQADAHANLGSIALGAGRIDEAIARYREALRVRPDFALAWAALGEALARAGQFPAAVEALEMALRQDPNLPEAHHNLASVCINTGRPEAAVAHAQEAVRLRPDFAEAHNTLGVAFVRLKRLDDAMREFETAIRLQALPNAKQNLAQLKAYLEQQGAKQ